LAPFLRPSIDPGEHRFVWDLREPPPVADQYDLPISAVPHNTPLVPQGALVPPGTYVVKLIVDGRTQSSTLHVSMDPRVSMTQAQLGEQYQMAHSLTVTITRSTAALHAARESKNQRAGSLESLQQQLVTLLSVIDGVDAPVTSQGRAAFCSTITRAQALGLQAAGAPHLCSTSASGQ
jgi:hypothetical protein